MKKLILTAVFLIILAPYGAQGFTVKGEIGEGVQSQHQTANASATAPTMASDIRALEKKVSALDKARKEQKGINEGVNKDIVALYGLSEKNATDISGLASRVDSHGTRLDKLDKKK